MSGPKVEQFMGFGSVTGNLARVRISLFQIPDSNPEVQEVSLFTKNVHKIAKITSFESTWISGKSVCFSNSRTKKVDLTQREFTST